MRDYFMGKESFVPSKLEKISDVFDFCKEHNVKFVDIKFMDFPGLWQHFTIPISEFSEDIFENGLGFDGSSIRGWRSINQSDLLVIPDFTTAMLDPFNILPTLSLIGNIYDPITHQPYNRDPRNIASKAEKYLVQAGVGDTAYFGPEGEFFIFDDIRYGQGLNEGYYFIDSVEGVWNTGREENPNLGYKPRMKEGYFPVPPTDSQQNLRSEMADLMLRCGLDVEAQHHEVATAGQAEIDMRYNKLRHQADSFMLYKYIVKNVARAHNKTATFMPKPLFGDNGSGMHTHVSIWSDGKNLFHDASDEYAGLSDFARYFIGGLLEHARAISAIVSPTVNSYRRLVPGYEAPVYLVWSRSNRSAAVRIPAYEVYNHDSKRVEYRPPDPSTNPYLAFIAIVAAGLDGIKRKIDPGDPVDENVYEMGEVKRKELGIKELPATLKEALDELENDNGFLREFIPRETIEVYIELKRKEYIEVTSRPSVIDYYFYLTV